MRRLSLSVFSSPKAIFRLFKMTFRRSLRMSKQKTANPKASFSRILGGIQLVIRQRLQRRISTGYSLVLVFGFGIVPTPSIKGCLASLLSLTGLSLSTGRNLWTRYFLCIFALTMTSNWRSGKVKLHNYHRHYDLKAFLGHKEAKTRE